MMDTYVRGARVVRVVDGDTVLLDVDLGFYVHVRMSCRLAGINAREHNQPGGAEATAHLAALLMEGESVTVGSVSADKYGGRFDGIILDVANLNVNERMVVDGYAARWDGVGSKPVPPWPIP